MLRLSKMADYAGVVVMHIAAHPARSHTATSLADALGLPKTTVAKCLKTLAKNGVLTSQRGVNGGYMLARLPTEISIAEVITAMDGPVKMASCTDGHSGDCQIEKTCPMRGGWDEINADIYKLLRGKSLADMVKQV
ncbi:MAG: SUF system Fe-S cluster assembly regulator [Alphaproteobacteria bacterium]|nr:SUF system Fe-S cluster assembly regulator [Alphaproteobacteria bacterium]